MFETTFSHKSSTALPPTVSIEVALQLLHDFETINRLNPDVRGQTPIQPKNGALKQDTVSNTESKHSRAVGPKQYYEVEDELPFIPKKLWSGGVRYQADFVPMSEGCEITIHAPAGFTSVNNWRLVHQEERTIESALEDGDQGVTSNHGAHPSNKFGQVKGRSDSYASGGQWYVEITSDAKCSRTFSSFVKGFLKNGHVQLQCAFADRAKEASNEIGDPVEANNRRPTIGRRKSSRF